MTHLKNLKQDCLKRLNILKAISSKNWGAEYHVLINTYKSLIRSKIDYGSVIYNSAPKNRLQILDPIHHAGARISTGAFRTSPVNAISSEANLPPLEVRRNQLSISYALAIATTPRNPAHQYTFNTKYLDTFEKKTKPSQTILYKNSQVA